ncbi:MAG: hypothetical protein U5K54_20555 [Cytophagales bacterium]|nr:hypothetical protein [Cytophagales bacterium]
MRPTTMAMAIYITHMVMATLRKVFRISPFFIETKIITHITHWLLYRALVSELQKERLELAEATGNPTEFAFLNLSESYLRTGNPLQSLMILKQAKEEFPTSGIVHNASGLVFSKLKISDCSPSFISRSYS